MSDYVKCAESQENVTVLHMLLNSSSTSRLDIILVLLLVAHVGISTENSTYGKHLNCAPVQTSDTHLSDNLL